MVVTEGRGEEQFGILLIPRISPRGSSSLIPHDPAIKQTLVW
ncbi:hypothetical protein EmuJ_000361300 [Echinococcus multilocularis]|uniref:Uncharacterized protein n=1 Tax=Echinococcus multilocularis TaxID=6211 RepID=A0A068Y284_ECHMU|nr:hypothetical protein EmuJ_000361300 [Echinococcus multilocularis]